VRRWRDSADATGESSLLDEILLTVNAIAGGLRTTG